MTGDITFSMIKPDIIQDGHVGEIITMIEHEGFRIKDLKLTKLSLERAGQFYAA